MSNLNSVMEAYAGRPKELIRCEGYLREIINLIHEERKGINKIDVLRKRSVYRGIEPCNKLEEELTKFFKVSEIRIFWNSGMINAYTLPASSFMIMNRRNNNTTSTTKIHIEVFEELVYYANLNERELLAVLLHEIGHNFYYNPILVASEMLTVVFTPLNIVLMFIGKAVYKGKAHLDNAIKRHLPFITNISTLINDIKIQFSDFLKPFKMAELLMKFVTYGVPDPIGRFFGSIGQYGNERGADSFCTKYGYGPEQASALKKLELSKGTIGGKMRSDMGTLGDLMNDFSSLSLDLIAMFIFDEHPNNNQRASSMLKKLERDLANNDYPPELKKDLENEIRRMRSVYETLNDNESNIEIKKAWYNMLDHATNGHSDIREIFDKFYTKYEF